VVFTRIVAAAVAVVLLAGILLARQSGPSFTGWQSGGPYTLAQVLGGQVLPLAVKRADLPPAFVPIDLSSGSSSRAVTYYAPYSSFSSNGSEVTQALNALASFTDGSIITVDGQRFYVTYKAPFPPHSGNGSLLLNLVRVDTVTSLTPLPKEAAKPDDRTEALSRIKQAGLATILYSNDYDDHYPWADSTSKAVTELMPYARNRDIFESPKPGGRFLFNVNLSGKSTTEILEPSQKPIWKEDLADKSSPFAVGYADGHARLASSIERNIIDRAWGKD
jgi:hypothetical protein